MIRLLLTWFGLLANAQAGIATRFGLDDPGNPRTLLACSARPRRNLSHHDMAVAHRDLPCRSRVLVCLPRNGRCTVGIVLDRGPFGKTRGKFTALIDLAPRVSRVLKHNGFEPAIVVALP